MAAAWGQGGGAPGMGAPGMGAPQPAPGGGAGGDVPSWMRNLDPQQLMALMQILGSKQGGAPAPVTPGAQPAANPLMQQGSQMMDPHTLAMIKYIQQMQGQGQGQQGPVTLADLFARQPGGQNTGLQMAPAYNAP